MWRVNFDLAARARVAAIVIALIAVLSCLRLPSGGPVGGSPVAHLADSVNALVAHLPAEGRVGFIAEGEDLQSACREDRPGWGTLACEWWRPYYVAQYALVPRVLVRPPATEEYVVAICPSACAPERTQGLRLVRSGSGGARLYRRASE